MEFTYHAYRELIRLLKDGGYVFTDYHTYADHPKCVIMRHDIDNDLEQAAKMAEIEYAEGIRSTYFMLLRTDFYNPASAKSQKLIQKILSCGHEIGLHFDEVAYEQEDMDVAAAVKAEADILSGICGCDITTVSMHRPSRKTLEANLQIPGYINSYGKTFFNDFKYLSDSRRNWREPVMDIVRSGQYDRLHILTHAFWYHPENRSISETVSAFVLSGNRVRYDMMSENIRDIDEIMKPIGE